MCSAASCERWRAWVNARLSLRPSDRLGSSAGTSRISLCAAVACAANAFEWAAFKESLPFTWYDTKYELRQAQKAKGVNYDLKLRENHADRAHQARMQNAEMHQRLGLTNHLYG